MYYLWGEIIPNIYFCRSLITDNFIRIWIFNIYSTFKYVKSLINSIGRDPISMAGLPCGIYRVYLKNDINAYFWKHTECWTLIHILNKQIILDDEVPVNFLYPKNRWILHHATGSVNNIAENICNRIIIMLHGNRNQIHSMV